MLNATAVIATYNYGHLLAGAVRSVMENAPGAEVVVVDDGSTDNTAAVVADLQHQYPVFYFQQPHAGKAAATRRGIDLATGDINFTLDADDGYFPGKREATLAIISEVYH